MPALHEDYEVYSELDIAENKSPRYFNHPSTDIICLSWAIDNDRPQVWWPHKGPPPDRLKWAKDNCIVHAHNAAYEHDATNVLGAKHGLPPLKHGRMRCSAARSAHAGLPRKLSMVCKQFGGEQKDMDGHKAMLRACKPNSKGERVWDPELLMYVGAYCAQDLRAERGLEDHLPPLPDAEQELWELDRRINERGVPVDPDFCRGANLILDAAYDRVQDKIAKATGGEITTGNQLIRMKKFCHERGFNIPNFQAETLTWIFENDGLPTLDKVVPLPDDIRAVLELRQYSKGAAVKKYRSALNSEWKGRIYDSMLFYAAHTGRFSSTGIQFHNFKKMKKGDRLDTKFIDVVCQGDLDLFDELYEGSPIDLLGRCVRALVKARDGHRLLMADYKQIECRLAHWLAGDHSTLDLFRAGGDPYKAMAAKIFNMPVSLIGDKSFERQVGKSAVLGCGYGMGYRRFAAQYGVPEHIAKKAVEVYRKENAGICKLWRLLDEAAGRCVKTGRGMRVGRVKFEMEREWLTLQLPCGRKLYYFKPKVHVGKKHGRMKTWISYLGVEKGKFVRIDMWGGTFLENICQAASRDLLCDAMMEMDRRGLPVILTVHDEIMLEAMLGEIVSLSAEVREIMTTNPPWAKGLPLGIDIEIKQRFEKHG